MKWPKRKPGFKDEVLWKLDALHHMYIELNNREDRKEFKRAWKEPKTWKLDKLPDGKWHFEWDVGPSGHGQSTGDFNHCLECMKRFEFMLEESDAKSKPSVVQQVLGELYEEQLAKEESKEEDEKAEVTAKDEEQKDVK
jgi:hypothetical protein